MVKLGKLPVKTDLRTVKIKMFLKALPPIPDEWDYDSWLRLPVPTPMFANDKWGDCAIAGKAHFTLRFEGFEQNKILPITDKEVLEQYWKEQGGVSGGCCRKKYPDNGIVELYTLKDWRKNGWTAAGINYNIYAFGSVNWKDEQEVKACIYLLTGVYTGLLLPDSLPELNGHFPSDEPWEVDDSPRGAPNPKNGHCVTIFGYDGNYYDAVTWGGRKKIHTDFFVKHCDEAYGIVDDKDKFMGDDSPVDIDLLSGYLTQITS